MTAEIAVANKFGIALAADSAVTIEQFVNGEIKEKVYNSANKLFTLSKWHPVGVMIYNTMTLGGVPWETIIKLVRKEIGKIEFDYLEQYVEFFVGKINSIEYLFDQEEIKQIALFNIYRLFIELPEGNKSSQILKNLDDEIKRLAKLEYVDGFDYNKKSDIVKQFQDEILRAYKMALKSEPTNKIKEKIDEFVGLSFSKQSRLPGYSGVVFCGYGKKDIYPKVVELTSDIVICGKARIWPLRGTKISGENNSAVLPFADTEIIATIMEGVNPRYLKKLRKEVRKMLTALPAEILAPVTQLTDDQKVEYAKGATSSILQALGSLLDGMREYRQEEHIGPIISTLAVLPASELAAVAETLLNASQIHKRVLPEIETVGGPVDVAVISKGDGFVWVKRKHYFDPSLNSAFLQKYMDGE